MSTAEYQPGETARMLGITQSTLAYWENHGWITCTRTDGGHRRYTLDEIQRADAEHRAGNFGNLRSHVRRELAKVTDKYPMWHCFIDSHDRFWAVYLDPDNPAVLTATDVESIREQINYYQGGKFHQLPLR